VVAETSSSLNRPDGSIARDILKHQNAVLRNRSNTSEIFFFNLSPLHGSVTSKQKMHDNKDRAFFPLELWAHKNEIFDGRKLLALGVLKRFSIHLLSWPNAA
jgi:hypothetical protein